MTVDRSPRKPIDSARLGVYGWDWSSTTHTAVGSPHTADGLAYDLLDALAPAKVLPGKGLQGWARSLQAYDAEGYRLGAVYFGGREDVHVQSTSSAADAVRPLIVAKYHAKTARVDSRVDTRLTFEDLRDLAVGIAGPKTQTRYVEGSVGKESTGRTLYVGSPRSMVQIRIYEKWLESPGQYEEGTNRVEVQLRPPSRGKEDVSGWSRAETFCATKLTRRLAEELRTEIATPGTLQKSKGTPDLERSLEAMGEQYGRVVDEWLRLSGGDVGRVIDYLTRGRS